MWIYVRTMDGKKSIQVDGLSKLTKIEDLRKRVEEEFDVPPERQRLFFSGKQLEDDHTLFDYGVALNSLVQVMIRPIINEAERNKDDSPINEGRETKDQSPLEDQNNNSDNNNNLEDANGIFKIDELVDIRDEVTGDWSEGIVVRVTKSNGSQDGGLIYHCIFDGFDEKDIHQFIENQLRPRTRTKLKWDEINEGDTVLVNYNPDEPKERGDWYDCIVTRKATKRNRNILYGILSFGEEHKDIKEECKVIITDEVFKIEVYGEASVLMKGDDVVKKKGRYECTQCYDSENKLCKECGCYVCAGKHNPDKLVLCDECNLGYHLNCLNPPLEQVPDEEWFCPKCKNDTSMVVKPGEKLTFSKRRMKMASRTNNSNRDWGKGMACAGRSKICTIVPENHFGPIPGVEVGTSWRFQIMAGEAGVHRNHVGGIHGRANEGAFSILVSGGYEDDVDNGDEVVYTGSGGRDLSGNKRTAEQSCDQKLDRFNRALAINCAAPIDEVNGATAKDWRAGKPTRLVRSFKLRKHRPKYAPLEGYRYDGIYKVVKYWPQKGQSGFLVWRFMLRRDDEIPAPWTKEGGQRIKDLGLTMQYPEGFLEAEAKRREQKEMEKEAKRLAKKNGDGKEIPHKQSKKSATLEDSIKKKRKRASGSTPVKEEVVKSTKKQKSTSYSLPEELVHLIKNDSHNEKSWRDLTDNVENYQKFLSRVQEVFLCICCQELVYQPVTTECKHNICKACLGRAFKAQVYSCPVCRHLLGKNFDIIVNTDLDKLLKHLFPGYTAGR